MIFGTSIAIVGGGLGGLAAAVILAHRGAKVTVYEQAPAFAEVGAGLQISQNGLRVLDAMGLGAQVREIGFPSQGVTLNSAQGRRVAILPNGARETRLVHRADLLHRLFEAAQQAGVRFVMNQKLTPDTRPDADLIIAADGGKSAFRSWVTGLEAQPRFSGQVAWRALVPVAKPIREGGVNVYMGPSMHLVLYPLRGGHLLNIVAVEETSEWESDGWSAVGDPDEMRDRFARLRGPVPALLERVSHVFRWGLLTHPVARPWYRDDVCLLGDAAHPMLPFLAQGACMALEDAWALAGALDVYPTPEAFAAYEALRAPRVARVMREAEANARRFHIANPVAAFAAQSALSLGARWAPGSFSARYRWLYDHDVTRSE